MAAKKANALKAAERAAERKGDLVAAILAAQQETRAFHGASSAAEIGAPEVSAALASIADVSAILNQSVPAGAALPHATSLQDTAALASPDLGGDRRKRYCIASSLYSSSAVLRTFAPLAGPSSDSIAPLLNSLSWKFKRYGALKKYCNEERGESLPRFLLNSPQSIHTMLDNKKE